jgi:putative lipoprotein (rSAM/lipoprotein system)
MKKIKISVLRKYTGIIAWLLALMGFTTGCSVEYGSPASEYGAPSAKFIVKGTVLSEDKNEPVANIKVVMGCDSVQTDTQGKYSVNNITYPWDTAHVMKIRDIDKETNGEFQPLDTTITFPNPTFKNGDGDWYKGETSKDLNIKIKPKN